LKIVELRFPDDDPERAAELERYFAERRAAVDGFVARQFGLRGTLRLHRSALGWDVARAPANALLSPILLLARIAAWACRKAGLHRAADWLAARRLFLATSVATRVEAAVVTDLLAVRVPAHPGAVPDRITLSHAILDDSRFCKGLQGGTAEAEARAGRLLAAIGEYAGTRSAIAEFTTALLTLAAGAVAFRALTPGMISMAPGVAGAISNRAAIADFALGESLGRIWYGVFPVGPDPWLVAATVAVLMGLGSLVTAFGGVIADPAQARLGTHRRRLLRLLDTLEAEATGTRDRPFVPREHALARVFDLWDAALSLVRVLRG
jgi:hypothetical protein